MISRIVGVFADTLRLVFRSLVMLIFEAVEGFLNMPHTNLFKYLPLETRGDIVVMA